MIIVGYLCLLIMGISLGLIGAGGSILTIPILVYLFEVPVLLATSYSLVIVGSVAFFASIRYREQIMFFKALIFSLPSLFGVFIARHYIIPNLPNSLWVFSIEQAMIILLLIFMVLAGYFMIRDFNTQNIIKHKDDWLEKGKISSLGLILGIIMGLLGAGGGFLIIPTLVLLMNFDMRYAVPTSLFIITINSLIGFLSDNHELTPNDWIVLINYLFISFLGMFAGLYLRRYINGKSLKKGFGWIILLIANIIVLKEFIF